MKMKKIFMLLVVMLTTAAFAACSDSDSDNSINANIKGLSVTPGELSFARGETTKTFLAQSPEAITATSDADWVLVSVGEKKGVAQVATVTVSVTANPGAVDRTATVTVTSGGETNTITITQSGDIVNIIEGTISGNAQSIAKAMYPGWNLGNTLEAPSGETGWQSTVTSQAIIDKVKELGFKSVRIPCSWNAHMDENGVIDAEWINRVRDIVNYCIGSGLYVLLNDHWDNGWIEVLGFSKSSASYVPVKNNYITEKETALKALWTQVAEAFAGYGDHLLFAGLNEPFQQYDLFNGRHAELTPILHRYNQAFVDAVRATGGNNATRTLVVQAPSTSIESAVSSSIGFTMPTDAVAGDGYLMVEVHYYEPWDFCGQEDNGKWFWGAANHVSGSEHNCTYGEESHVASQMQAVKTKFVDNGYPVIIGECGANWRELSANQDEHDASIKAWFKELNTQAVNNGCVTMVWDINSPYRNGEKGIMTVLDRANLSVFCSFALDGIKEGTAAGTWPY